MAMRPRYDLSSSSSASSFRLYLRVSARSHILVFTQVTAAGGVMILPCRLGLLSSRKSISEERNMFLLTVEVRSSGGRNGLRSIVILFKRCCSSYSAISAPSQIHRNHFRGGRYISNPRVSYLLSW
ncbi:hypothetical protein C8R45DRAFT_1081216, partial [Mycena sanguinolenta]